MKYNRRKISIISSVTIVAVCVVLGLFLFNKKDLKNIRDNLRSDNKHKPSMTIKGFNLEQTDGDRTEWVLNSKYASMYNSGSQNSYMVFQEVNTKIYDEENKGDLYDVRAKSGTYWVKDDKIDLEGNVSVSTPKGYVFNTQDAFYDIKNKKVTTRSEVSATGTINGGDIVDVEGAGLSGSINEGDFYLIGKVTAKMANKLNVRSKRALFDTKKESVSFLDNVTARKNNMNISGNELVVSYDKKGDMSDINVYKNVLIKVDNKKAICENATIKVNSDEVILTGKPEFHAGSDIIVGEKIVFYTNSDEVYVSKVRAAVSEKGVRKK